MPKLSIWKGVGVKTKDYQLIDRLVSEQYRIGGTEFWIHKYLGPATQVSNGDTTLTNSATSTSAFPELDIQDVLNMEIRDRNYETDIYVMRGHYQMSDNEFSLGQFGMFLNSDTLLITFHLNDMVNQIGRKLMSGDVIEVVHLRDDLVLGQDIAVSKFYVVEEGIRPAEGWSPTWWPHIWRVKCQPITDSQEFSQIFNAPATDAWGDPIPNNDGNGNVTTVGDLLSTYNKELSISDAIVQEAENQVPFRNIQGTSYYVYQTDIDKPYSLWSGDGIPPNHSKPVPQGTVFPTDAAIGDYFLRTDYLPSVLYQRQSAKWVRIEVNYRTPWLPANEILKTFINNNSTTTYTDGTTAPEKQNIRTAIKPKLDPNIE